MGAPHVRKKLDDSKLGDASLKIKFGAVVRRYRRRLCISQEELAWRANMHRTYLADIERGGRNLSLLAIVRLISALRVPLTEFFHDFEKHLLADGMPNALVSPGDVVVRPAKTAKRR